MIQYLRSRRYAILFVFVISLLAMIPLVAHISVDFIFKPQVLERQAGLYENLNKILSDLQGLEANPVFPDSASDNNAEYLISRYISFDGMDNMSPRHPRYSLLKKVDQSFNEWRHNPDVLEKMLYDKKLMSLNTNWLERLHNYDHWNFSSSTHVKEALAIVPSVNSMTRVEIFTQLPTPNYSMMRNFALIHFLKKAKQGRAAEGIKTYRKVAELIHTTGTIVGSMTAASMLKEEYILVSKFDIKNWTPRPYYYIDAYIRVSWAWVGLLKLPLFDRLPRKFVRYMKPQNGVCGSAWESFATYSVYLDFFQPQTVFESNFSKNVKFTNELLKTLQDTCGLHNYAAFLTRSPSSVSPFNSSFKVDASIYNTNSNTDYNYTVQDNWIYLPYIRRLVGLRAFANPGSMNYVMRYQTKKKKFAGINFEF